MSMIMTSLYLTTKQLAWLKKQEGGMGVYIRTVIDLHMESEGEEIDDAEDLQETQMDALDRSAQ